MYNLGWLRRRTNSRTADWHSIRLARTTASINPSSEGFRRTDLLSVDYTEQGKHRSCATATHDFIFPFFYAFQRLS